MPPRHVEDEEEDTPRGKGNRLPANLMTKGMSIEQAQANVKAAAGRMLGYEVKAERMRREEDETIIAQQFLEGDITMEEAQKRVARGIMHKKEQAEADKPKIKGIVAAGADFKTTEQMLEDHLDTNSKSYFIRCIKKSLGIAWIERQVKIERTKRADKKYVHSFPLTRAIVSSTAFELAIGAVMIVNGATIGVQASKSAAQQQEEDRKGVSIITMLEHIMTGIFCAEIVLRMLSDGWIWIWNKKNAADTGLILITGVVPLWILGPASLNVGEIRNLQVLRVVRLVRLVRMVRTVKMFRTFWKLIQGIMDSVRTLFWMYILVGAVLYTFAIFSVYWIGKDPALENDEVAQVHFGDVPKAMMTLFQVMTLDSWSFITRPLMKQSPDNAQRICLLFIVVIMVCTLVLMNLVTAVICNNAFERGKQDQELNAMMQREAVAAEIEDLRSIFAEIDADGSGYLSKEEYDDALKTNGRVQTKFEVLQIGPEEREEIWELIDTGSGEVSVDQFADTLRAIQGEAKAKESYTIVKEVTHLNKHLQVLAEQMDQHRNFADEVREECAMVHRQLGGALLEMIEFVTLAGACIPSNPAPRSKKSLEDLTTKIQKKVDHMERIRLEQQAQRDAENERLLERRRSNGRAKQRNTKRGHYADAASAEAYG